jgi:4-amino-4-deoxy-L-arabinose transferase-like glycosyltransferase
MNKLSKNKGSVLSRFFKQVLKVVGETKTNKYILLILLFSAIIRLVTVEKLLAFTPDEEYLIYLAQTIIKNFHIIWIGVSSLGFDLYMGPLWIYVITPPLMISKGNPLILGYFACILGVFSTFLLYWFGQKLFNQKVGLIACLIYAASPLIIFYDQKIYPSGVPLLSLVLATSIYMAKYSGKWWVLFAVAYGMVFHIHLSLILIIFVALYWAILYKKQINIKIILLSVLAFLITVSPLIAFDYFHKYSNISVPIRILKSAKKNPVKINLKYRSSVFLNALGRVFYLTPKRESSDEILFPCIADKITTTTRPNRLFTFFPLLFVILFVIRKNTWKNDKSRLLVLLSASYLIPFLFLPIINPVEYYLLGFFPLLFLIISSVIESFNKPVRYFMYLLVLFYIIFGIYTVTVAKGSFGMITKKVLIAKVMDIIKNEPYELSETGGCHAYEGWRYLFSTYGRRPERSSEDSNFSWLYPDDISKTPAKYSVLISETRVPTLLKGKYKYVFEEGGFTTYIFTK